MELKLHRNDLAHDLPRFLSDSAAEIQVEKLETIIALVTKIDRWWIVNVEIDCDPNMDGRTIDPTEITSGNMLYLHLLLGLSTGAHSTELYEQMKNAMVDGRMTNKSKD